METKKTAVFGVLALLVFSIVALVSLSATVSAVPVAVDFVKIDGDIVSGNEVIEVDRNTDLDIKVKLLALANAEDVRVEAMIQGFEHGVISDESDIFDMDSGETYTKKLSIHLPDELERNNYLLRVIISDRDSELFQQNYNLNIDTARHSMKIEDVSFSPGTEIQSGRSLLTTVRLENKGEMDEEVKVTVAIPDLGVQQADFIDEVESDETVTSEELFLRIPACAAPGQYTVDVELSFNDGFDSMTEQRTITVVDGGLCNVQDAPAQTEKTLIAIATEGNANIKVGQKAVYPVTLTNAGSEAKIYSIGVTGADWATVEVSPSNVVALAPGEIKTTFVALTPNEGAAGTQLFNVNIKAGEQTLKTVNLATNVEAGKSGSTLVRGLTIGLIIIIVILVILGLILAFSRMKGRNDDFEDFEDEGQKTYY
ncbi:hypothetical protein KY335_05545 [Candidatus Woesearchaeota archaeon]|nr:hypothetical protein [Candidatus Woesearchaeota archaeon]